MRSSASHWLLSGGRAALLMASAVCGAAAAAQSAPAASSSAVPAQGGVADIVVTAQRRAENLQKVGIAITALGSADIQKMGSSDARDIAKRVPGVLLDSTSGGSLNANLVVRGISQSDFSSNQESPNSIYIDDVYLSSPNAAAFTLYDLDRVEILRGPQGTLFGRASSGGLANFIVAKPTKNWTGYAELGYGSYNQAWAEAAVSGPLSDKIRFRLSGRAEEADGYYINEAPGGRDTMEKLFFGVRGQLEADLTENLTARLSVGYDKNPRHREGTYTPETWYVALNGQPAPVPANLDVYGTGPGADFSGYRRPDNWNVWRNEFNSHGHLSSTRVSPTLNLQWGLGDATITSITNYTHFKYNYIEDSDGGPVDYSNYLQAQDLKQFSEELRINGKVDRLTYTAGFYFLNVNQTAPIGYDTPALAGTAFAFTDTNAVHQKTRSYAAFGQLEYALTDKLKFTLGGRYTHDHKTMDEQVLVTQSGTTLYNPPLVIFDFSKQTVGSLATESEGMFSGKVGLDYQANSNTLLYASVSRGVKGPGFNTNLSGNLPVDQTPFKSEYLYAYEVGAKVQLFDRKLRINIGAFNYDYHRFQGYAFTGLQGIVGNYNGYFRGGELQVDVSPGQGVNASLGVAYLRTKLRDVPTAYDGIRDEQSINAPKWTLNGLISKDFQIGDNRLSVQWSGNYIDHRYASLDNNPATYLKGSFVHNARISYKLMPANVEFAVFVNNISNKARQTFAYDLISSQGNRMVSYDRPRWFGGSIRKTF